MVHLGGRQSHGGGYQVHRLVLLAFVGLPPSDKPQAAHWNGVKDHNRVENLRWADQFENFADNARLNIERHPKNHLTDSPIRESNVPIVSPAPIHGKRAHFSRFTPDDVVTIRKASCNGESTKSIAARYDSDIVVIRGILLGRTWKELPVFDRSDDRIKLSYDDIVEIRSLLASGTMTGAAIARQFNVSTSLISKINLCKRLPNSFLPNSNKARLS